MNDEELKAGILDINRSEIIGKIVRFSAVPTLLSPRQLTKMLPKRTFVWSPIEIAFNGPSRQQSLQAE